MRESSKRPAPEVTIHGVSVKKGDQVYATLNLNRPDVKRDVRGKVIELVPESPLMESELGKELGPGVRIKNSDGDTQYLFEGSITAFGKSVPRHLLN